MSTQSELVDGLHGVTVPAGIKAVLEAHADAARKLDAEPLLPTAKAERKTLLWKETQAKIDGEVTRIEAETARALDAEEGALRARAKGLSGERLDAERRAVLDSAREAGVLLVRELDDPGTIAEQLESAMLSEDPTTIRVVGTLVVQKLRSLERAAKPGAGRAVVTQILSAVESRFSTWRRDNPSSIEELRAIERERGSAKAALRYAVETALRVYGISSKAGNLHVGAAFDRLSA